MWILKSSKNDKRTNVFENRYTIKVSKKILFWSFKKYLFLIIYNNSDSRTVYGWAYEEASSNQGRVASVRYQQVLAMCQVCLRCGLPNVHWCENKWAPNELSLTYLTLRAPKKTFGQLFELNILAYLSSHLATRTSGKLINIAKACRFLWVKRPGKQNQLF